LHWGKGAELCFKVFPELGISGKAVWILFPMAFKATLEEILDAISK
jgi:hypothetical protein